MTHEEEIQWREEFEKLINYRSSIRFYNGVYADNRLHQKWIGFKTAKEKAQKEISQLKEELKRERFFTNEVARMSSNHDEFESNGGVGEYRKQDHRYAYEVIIGLARQTQQQRRIEL